MLRAKKQLKQEHCERLEQLITTKNDNQGKITESSAHAKSTNGRENLDTLPFMSQCLFPVYPISPNRNSIEEKWGGPESGKYVRA